MQRRTTIAHLSNAAVVVALVAALAPAAADAQGRFRGRVEAYADAAPMRGPVAGLVPPGLVVAGWDAQRGVPNLLVGRRAPVTGGRATLGELAARHVLELAPLYGVGGHALEHVERVSAHPTPNGGALVTFAQRVDGIDVLDSRLAILVDGQGALIAAGGRLLPVSTRPYAFHENEPVAVERALADAFDVAPAFGAVTRIAAGPDGWTRYVVGGPGVTRGYALDRPARARPVLYPLPTRLVPGWELELWLDSGELVVYVVSAEDGALLRRRSLTDHDSYEYSVYADGTAPFTPIDSPFGDTTPDFAGMPVIPVPPYVSQTSVVIEGFNTNPSGAADPWLASGATTSRGNNVDAYADIASPDGFNSGDLRASTTAAGVFGHAFDSALAPDADATQRQAVVTHLFYVNNWLHDYFYDVGFDEAAGNAQADNFGRGGEEGDRLRAEAMDYRGRNNANMSTPSDGESPRMQMYLWDGIQDAGVVAGGTTYDVGIARFGPEEFDVTAPTVLVDDGSGTVTDACEGIDNDLTGAIALIDRGSCNFDDKVARAEARGAVGVIIMNDDVGAGTITMGGSGPTSIPSLMVSREDGAILRAAEGASTRIHRSQLPDAPSSLDSQVVVHEWGHYLHRRLVAWGSDQAGAESEGWGDFLSVMMLMRAADDLNGAYPTASFSNHGDEPIYYGTRRVPYSANRAFNDLSFRHISDGEALPTSHPVGSGPSANSEVHNAGEIWATMMFDALVAMLDRSTEPGAPYTFEEALERMAGYIVRGMQLAPSDPTFTEQRDTIIAAAVETDVEDARRIAAAFAGRGAGTCAVSPDRYSETFSGVVEDFGLAALPTIVETGVDLTGPGRLCDGDDVLDAGEEGHARVVVRNDGVEALRGATLTVDVDDTAVTFPSGAALTIPDLAPGGTTELFVPLAIDVAATPSSPLTVSATVSGSLLCADVTDAVRVPVDRDAGLLDHEDFEVRPDWLSEVSLDTVTTGVWSVGPSSLGDPDWVLRGIDSGSITDTAVELPEFTASSTANVVLSFEHRYEFERDATTLWDGGVIEYSTDGGATWEDVTDLGVDPGYDGPLSDTADNPLALRDAYCGENPSSPAADTVRLDFGTALAGETVRFRFRIGTDQASGDPGWEIDDVTIEGADPLPFPGFVADASDCADAPIADAGPDQEVEIGTLVTLDGSGSSDPNGDTLTFAWEVLDGATVVTLSDPTSPVPTFTAPDVTVDTDFRFLLRVSDGTGSDADDVIVRVLAPEAPMDPDAGMPPMMDPDAGTPPVMMDPDAGTPMMEGDAGEMPPMDDGGCGCRVVGAAPAPVGLGWGFLLVALAHVGARRGRSRARARARARAL